jgi:hypothetical protein
MTYRPILIVFASVLFENDPSIITEPDVSSLIEVSNHILTVMNDWCIPSEFTLNFDETNFIEFVSNNNRITNIPITYNDQYIKEIKAKAPRVQVIIAKIGEVM